jgi:hypothetical protein
VLNRFYQTQNNECNFEPVNRQHREKLVELKKQLIEEHKLNEEILPSDEIFKEFSN